MKRKLALLTAVFMLVFSLSTLAAGFSDMPEAGSEYYAAFEYAVNAKIISGVDGKILPQNPVTKAEAVTFISRAKPFSQAPADLSAVTDMTPDAWYYNTMAQAVAAKVIDIENNTLKPAEVLTRRAAWDLLHKIFGNPDSYTPVTEGEKPATRGDFILWLYNYIKPTAQQPGETAPTEGTTEAPTEAKTEYNDLKALKAQEDMRVALGIRADGSSYTQTVVYTDTSQTDWASGKVSSSSSSRPSGGGSSSNKPSDDDDDDRPTQAPTEEPTEEPNNPSEPETQAPTEEPETQAPTYGEYDGPIDNDKDNVIDDPFNDGWRPPGFGGDTDDSGSGGGFDEEDEDFIVNDDEDPGFMPETKPTENETEAPSDEETNNPSDEETEAPTDEETNAPSDEESDVPSDEETNAPSDEESDTPSDEETDVPSDEESDAPSDEETATPSDEESDAPSDEETDNTDETPATEPDEEAGDVTDDSTDDSTDEEDGEDEDETNLLAWLFSKDWWFS